MDAPTATAWVLVGSAIFLVGAGIGVPRVFTEPTPAERLRMLEDGIVRWRVAQPLYAIGPVVAAVGVGFLAVGIDETPGRIWLALSCLLLLAGPSAGRGRCTSVSAMCGSSPRGSCPVGHSPATCG